MLDVLDLLECVLAVSRRDDGLPVQLERIANGLPQIFFVVDDENCMAHRHTTVRGNVTLKTVPCSWLDCTEMSPPCATTISYEM
jgi:hypothetical protein